MAMQEARQFDDDSSVDREKAEIPRTPCGLLNDGDSAVTTARSQRHLSSILRHPKQIHLPHNFPAEQPDQIYITFAQNSSHCPSDASIRVPFTSSFSQHENHECCREAQVVQFEGFRPFSAFRTLISKIDSRIFLRLIVYH